MSVSKLRTKILDYWHKYLIVRLRHCHLIVRWRHCLKNYGKDIDLMYSANQPKKIKILCSRKNNTRDTKFCTKIYINFM